MGKKVRDYSVLAKDILGAVGGKDNIQSVTRCATRLRIVLKNDEPTAKGEVASLPGVITVVENSGQFQVVIGQHVGEVYEEFISFIDIDLDNVDIENKGTVLNRIIATMSAVFAPFVYILAASGLLQGALILSKLLFSSFADTGTYQVLSFISWAPFTYLPIFIAITASKHFKSNTYIAVACCVALVSQSWGDMAGLISSGTSINFIGIPLSETVYTSSVLPPLFLVWILSYLEKFLNKYVNEVVRPIIVPLLCLSIMVPLTLVSIGPVTSYAAYGIANGYNFLVEYVPAIAAVIIGAFYQLLVIFGIHWGTTPMILANYEQYGQDSFQVYITIAVISQVGAVLGVFLKSKSKEIRKISASAALTGLFGITEPAIYGVTLRFKKPFIFGCIGGGVGALVASFFNPYYFAYAGLSGPLTIINGYEASHPSSVWGIIIGSAIAIVLPVILTQLFGYGEDTAQVVTETASIKDTVDYDLVVSAPLEGKIIPLAEIEDEVFSSGAMGQGVAIAPSDNKVLAPFDGQVIFVAPTKHAIGIASKDGVELLIHVGMDTVTLEGAPFDVKFSEGESFSVNDVLMTFDKEFIENKGLSVVTPVIVTNSSNFKELIIDSTEDSIHSNQLFTVIH